jgi:hypothetical protein
LRYFCFSVLILGDIVNIFAFNYLIHCTSRVKDPRTILKLLPLEEGINLTLEVVNNNEVILFKSRFEDLERNNRLGVLIYENYISNLNKLKTAWYELIDLFTDDNVKQIIKHSQLKLESSNLLSKFQAASIRLHEWKNEFENLPNSHIERSETTEILTWINSELSNDEKGIALLVGDAGAGKSVVMRDVLHELEALGIPVLGLKADQYCVDNIENLEKRLDLKDGIDSIIIALVQENERVVVLIDQIDALSQSLSARREYLETFTRLIILLSNIKAVRIIVSCRTYDLQNDHEFSFFQKQRKIHLGKLKDEEVKSVLQKLSPEISGLPDDLIELLKTPLHLNVFCQVYRPELPFERIKAHRDLYEELWIQKIDQINAPASTNLSTKKITLQIYDMAHTMYDRQSLVILAKPFRSKYPNELVYLKSTGIVLESTEGLTFFHQTFYDFAFAKQFVKNGISIETYLLDNGQNLHIRSCLKMMVEFLRESDWKEYLRVQRTILTSQEYYFHIKSLLISLLGFVKEPNSEEIQLACDIIFLKPQLFKAFISSIKSRKWLLFLLEEKQLHRLIESIPKASKVELDAKEREHISNQIIMLNGLLLRHLPECRHEVLEFISDLPEIEGKEWLVERMLYNIEKWDNPLTFSLFDRYRLKFDILFIAKFLKDAAKNNLSWALDHLKKIVSEIVESHPTHSREVHLKFSLAQLITYFIENYPEPSFDLLFTLQLQKMDSLKNLRKLYNSNTNHNDFIPILDNLDENNRERRELFPLLIDSVRVLAENNSPRFHQFVTENSGTNSVMRLLILIEGFRANPFPIIPEIECFFENFLEKQGLDASDTLCWRARKLLNETYLHFSDSKKRHIIQLISQLEPEREKEWPLEWIGETKFKWLKCLPENDIFQNIVIRLSYQELAQRFHNVDDNDPDIVRGYKVGPPLDQETYERMTNEEWIMSFKKFDEKYEGELGSEKGGMQEHARQFEAEVKKRPDFFYPILTEMTILLDLPKTYLVHGVSGLNEAKFQQGKLLNLLKKIELNGFESWEVSWLMSNFRSLIYDKIEDNFIINFLATTALTHSDPLDDTLKVKIKDDEVESLYNSGFNSVRGSAVNLLPQLYYFKNHKELLFQTLEQIAENDLLSVRCQMVTRLALLTNLDKERSLNLFLRLVRDNEAAIIEHSTWSAQYLVRQNFELMKPYFEKALLYPKIHKDMAMILSLTWIFEREDAIDLLNKFLAASEKAKAGAVEIAASNITDDQGKPNSKSIELFVQFLKESSEEVIHAYDFAFSNLKPIDFPHLQPLLVHYSKSVVARRNPRPFYEYLITCTKAYPEACLELVENFAEYDKPDIRYAGYYDKEPLKVVINAYNVLWGRKIKDQDMLKKALLLFDKMLIDDRFRGDAEDILTNIEG